MLWLRLQIITTIVTLTPFLRKIVDKDRRIDKSKDCYLLVAKYAVETTWDCFLNPNDETQVAFDLKSYLLTDSEQTTAHWTLIMW